MNRKRHEKKRKGLVPKLRFPAFRDSGEWENCTLGDKEISFFVKERIAIEQVTLDNYVSTENLLPNYDGVTIASKLPPTGSCTRFSAGDILISNIRPYLKKVWAANRSGGSSNDVIIVRSKSKIEKVFLALLLRNDDFINYVMIGAKGVKMPRGDISLMKEYPIVLPKLPEQQKIADCLTSLDELITAEAGKLEAYKSHKKGLMQKLFPAEGETEPEWRFPGFLGMGEWEEKKIGELGELVSGLTYSPDDIREKGLLVLRSSNVKNGMITLEDNVYVRPDIRGANLSRPNDILICVRNGSKALIGKNAIIPENMPLCTHGAFMTIFRTESYKFIFQLFQADAYEKQVAADLGATINSINGNQLKKYVFFVPNPNEQHKIVDCLSSLDELITAQSKKIDTLKTHKKGLMQGLFPVC